MAKTSSENGTTAPLPSASAYMTLAEAAARLGMEGAPSTAARRLRRILLAKEEEMDRPFMLRAPWGAHPRFLVTLAMLEEHCPELFLKRVQMTELMREAIEEIESRLCKLDRQDRELAEAMLRMRNRGASAPAVESKTVQDHPGPRTRQG